MPFAVVKVATHGIHFQTGDRNTELYIKTKTGEIVKRVGILPRDYRILNGDELKRIPPDPFTPSDIVRIVAQPIPTDCFEATVSEISRREGGFIRARISIVNSNGKEDTNSRYATVVGIRPNDVNIVKGGRYFFNGYTTYYYNKVELEFTEVKRLPLKPYDIEWRAVQACMNDKDMRKALAENNTPEMTKAQLERLRRDIGPDWAARIAQDNFLLDAFPGNKKSRKLIISVAEKINGLSDIEKALYAVGLKGDKFKKAIKELSSVKMAQFRRDRDAVHFVRGGHLTPAQAEFINANCPGFKGGSVPAALPYIWKYMLDQLKDRGATAINKSELVGYNGVLVRQYGVSWFVENDAIKALLSDYSRIVEVENDVYALAEIYKLADNINDLRKHFQKQELSAISVVSDFRLDGEQQRAIDMSASSPISAITGGPGTGKTTILGVLARHFGQDNVIGIAVAARAARVLRRAAGINTYTIARFISPYSDYRGGYNGKALFIDEASMVTDNQMLSILNNAKNVSHIVLSGDKDQLGPIGSGRPFADLVNNGHAIPITKLKTIHRTSEGGGIARIGADIRDFQFNPANSYDGVNIVSALKDTQIAQIAARQYMDWLSSGMNAEDIGLLCPYNSDRYVLTANNLNNEIRKLRGLPSHPVIGDIVINTENDYGREYPVLNGMRGVIVDVKAPNKNHDGTMSILYDGEEKPIVYNGGEDYITYGKDATGNVQGLPFSHLYGYASTVHKAQGSEFERVIVVAPESLTYSRFMDAKTLLYTACTRAKKELVIVEYKGAVENISNKNAYSPETALQHILPKPPVRTTVVNPASTQDYKSLMDRFKQRYGLEDISARLARLKAMQDATVEVEEVDEFDVMNDRG
jgi:AAA domain/UvrD-like helicase C-terminal domain